MSSATLRTTFETQRAALADVVAIPVTPFAEDGRIDRETHRALLRRLLDGGVTTLTPTPASSTPSPPRSGSSSPN